TPGERRPGAPAVSGLARQELAAAQTDPRTAPRRAHATGMRIAILSAGDGTRLEADSHPYRLMRRWILQGMPYGNDNDPTVARIEVFPSERTMPQNAPQQLLVIAHYTNGVTEDVTGTVKFEPN